MVSSRWKASPSCSKFLTAEETITTATSGGELFAGSPGVYC
jgi:hypothetical protein